MNILLTGGHLSPALALIDELSKYKDIHISYVGRSYHFAEHKKAPSVEKQTMHSLSLPFIETTAPRFPRKVSFTMFTFPFYFVKAIFESFPVILREKPDLIVTFGSYVSVPVCIAGFLFHKPIFLHEQALIPGYASRLLGILSKKIAVGWHETVNQLPTVIHKKVIVLGIPLRKAIIQETKHIPVSALTNSIDTTSKTDKLPILLVCGGTTGAHAINMLIQSILSQLTDTYNVVFQCGESKYNDYESIINTIKIFSNVKQRRVFCVKHLSSNDYAYTLKKASLVVSRCGINTLTEFAFLGKPSVLIPLPESSRGEQQKGAKMLERAKMAVIVDQFNTTPKTLCVIIKDVFDNLDTYTLYAKNYSHSKEIQIHKTASASFAHSIFNYFNFKPVVLPKHS